MKLVSTVYAALPYTEVVIVVVVTLVVDVMIVAVGVVIFMVVPMS